MFHILRSSLVVTSYASRPLTVSHLIARRESKPASVRRGEVGYNVLRMKGEFKMAERDSYQGFSEEKQRDYEEEIRQRYGDKELKQSQQRWGGYSAQQKLAIQEEFDRIVKDLRDRMGEGHDSPEVQARIKELHAWIGNFYDCTLDVFEGLGHGYNQHPDFRKMYETNYGPGVSEFLEKAIVSYCDQQPRSR